MTNPNRSLDPAAMSARTITKEDGREGICLFQNNDDCIITRSDVPDQLASIFFWGGVFMFPGSLLRYLFIIYAVVFRKRVEKLGSPKIP